MSAKGAKERMKKRLLERSIQQQQQQQAPPSAEADALPLTLDDTKQPPAPLPRIFSLIADSSDAASLELQILTCEDECRSTINHPSGTKGTPLMFAIWNASTLDRLDMIDVLLKYGADVHARDSASEFDVDKYAVPPLFLAAAKPCLMSLELLVSRGARLDDTVMVHVGTMGHTPMRHPPMNLFSWTLYTTARRCTERFMRKASIINQQRSLRQTGVGVGVYGVPIPRADPVLVMQRVAEYMRQHSESAAALLKRSVYARLPTMQKTLVGTAVSIHAPATLQLLLDMGCDPNTSDMDDWSPLYSACVANDVEMALLLVERGAVPDERTIKEFGSGNGESGVTHPALLRYQWLRKASVSTAAAEGAASEEGGKSGDQDGEQVSVILDALGDAGFLDLEDSDLYQGKPPPKL